MIEHPEAVRLQTAELSKQLLELIMEAEKDTQSWIKFLLTIETAFVIAFSFLLHEFNDNTHRQMGLATLLALAGIAGAITIGEIVRRLRRWHTWYIQKYNELPGMAGIVFANTPGVIDTLPAGYIGQRVRYIQIAVVLGWILALGIAFCSLS